MSDLTNPSQEHPASETSEAAFMDVGSASPANAAAEMPIRVFTLEEAGALVPTLRKLFYEAHLDLRRKHDELIVFRRLHQQKQHLLGQDGDDDVLQAHVDAFDATLKHWLQKVADLGVLVKDFERGLIDFPYRSKSGQLFFLCWHPGEDGVFYFRLPTEELNARKPITILPD
ncbi:MAG: DUF2203 domain-containing protein [Vampirovibrionales bacterium]|nr:DUF2203 domain-containing protein [Vampirovibrionales bacterium]